MYNFQPYKFVAIDLKHKLYKFHKVSMTFNKSQKHGTTKLHPNINYYYENGILLILVIFVDDLVITKEPYFKNQIVLRTIKSNRFYMCPFGLFNYIIYYGVEFHCDPWSILMCHKNFILKCLINIKMSNFRPSLVPLLKGFKQHLEIFAKYLVFGGKMHIMILSQFDICFAIKLVFQFMQSPQQPWLNIAKTNFLLP